VGAMERHRTWANDEYDYRAFRFPNERTKSVEIGRDQVLVKQRDGPIARARKASAGRRRGDASGACGIARYEMFPAPGV
jgi:hypothetical protein